MGFKQILDATELVKGEEYICYIIGSEPHIWALARYDGNGMFLNKESYVYFFPKIQVWSLPK